MKNNLQVVRNSKNITAQELASLANTTLTQIQRLEWGQRKLTVEWAIRLAKVLECTPAEIIGYDVLGIEDSKELENINSNNVIIPYYVQKASAGKGIVAQNDEKYPLVLNKNWLQQEFALINCNNLFALDANGDSMEPLIKSGDTLICQEVNHATEGVYIIYYNGNVLVKRVVQTSDTTLELISENKEYPNIQINLEKVDIPNNFRILAKVIGTIHSFAPLKLRIK